MTLPDAGIAFSTSPRKSEGDESEPLAPTLSLQSQSAGADLGMFNVRSRADLGCGDEGEDALCPIPNPLPDSEHGRSSSPHGRCEFQPKHQAAPRFMSG